MVDTASMLAGWLDWEMLDWRGVPIADAGLSISELPVKTGDAVFAELGGRPLIRYLVRSQVGFFRNGSRARHYMTPTAYSPSEALAFLLLPTSEDPREWALLLDPRRIPVIAGPQWVAGHTGIQYVALVGFPAEAIVVPGAPGAAWEIRVH